VLDLKPGSRGGREKVLKEGDPDRGNVNKQLNGGGQSGDQGRMRNFPAGVQRKGWSWKLGLRAR